MKVTSGNSTESISVGQVQQIDSFKLAQTKEFFSILSKNLYTDPELAMVRELMCNAWDAHIAAGIEDKPIKAEINDGVFYVKDWGKGIPHDQIAEIYGVYGGSTKLNEIAQTGGFGLGCKTPFAVTEQFIVEDIYEGKKGIYSCIREDPKNNGLPSIRRLSLIGSDEPSGITVKVPLPDSIPEWKIRQMIQEIAWIGGIKTNDFKLAYPKTEHDIHIIHENQINNVHGSCVDTVYFRQGNVVYPAPRDAIEKVFGYWNTFPYVVVLDVAPESMSITPSREKLSLDDRTKERVLKELNYIKSILAKSNARCLRKFQDYFANNKNRETSLFGTYFHTTGINENQFTKEENLWYSLRRVLSEKAKFKNLAHILPYKVFKLAKKISKKYAYITKKSAYGWQQSYNEFYIHRLVDIYKEIFGEYYPKVKVALYSSNHQSGYVFKTLDSLISKQRYLDDAFKYTLNTVVMVDKITQLSIPPDLRYCIYLLIPDTKKQIQMANHLAKEGFRVLFLPNETKGLPKVVQNPRTKDVYKNAPLTYRNPCDVNINDIDCWTELEDRLYFYKLFFSKEIVDAFNISYYGSYASIGNFFKEDITCITISGNKYKTIKEKKPDIEKYIDDLFKAKLTHVVENSFKEIMRQFLQKYPYAIDVIYAHKGGIFDEYALTVYLVRDGYTKPKNWYDTYRIEEQFMSYFPDFKDLSRTMQMLFFWWLKNNYQIIQPDLSPRFKQIRDGLMHNDTASIAQELCKRNNVPEDVRNKAVDILIGVNP